MCKNENYDFQLNGGFSDKALRRLRAQCSGPAPGEPTVIETASWGIFFGFAQHSTGNFCERHYVLRGLLARANVAVNADGDEGGSDHESHIEIDHEELVANAFAMEGSPTLEDPLHSDSDERLRGLGSPVGQLSHDGPYRPISPSWLDSDEGSEAEVNS